MHSLKAALQQLVVSPSVAPEPPRIPWCPPCPTQSDSQLCWLLWAKGLENRPSPKASCLPALLRSFGMPPLWLFGTRKDTEEFYHVIPVCFHGIQRDQVLEWPPEGGDQRTSKAGGAIAKLQIGCNKADLVNNLQDHQAIDIYIYAYITIHTYMRVFIHLFIYIYIYYVHLFIHTCVYIYTCVYIHVCVCQIIRITFAFKATTTLVLKKYWFPCDGSKKWY